MATTRANARAANPGAGEARTGRLDVSTTAAARQVEKTRPAARDVPPRDDWFAKVPAALFQSDLSTGARMTYAALCLHADGAGVCWPRQRQLVLETGATARSVKRWLKELEAAGVITRTRATGKWGRPTTYQLHRDRLGATVSPKVRGHSVTKQGATVSPKSGHLGATVSPPSEQIHSGEQSHRTASSRTRTRTREGRGADRHPAAAAAAGRSSHSDSGKGAEGNGEIVALIAGETGRTARTARSIAAAPQPPWDLETWRAFLQVKLAEIADRPTPVRNLVAWLIAAARASDRDEVMEAAAKPKTGQWERDQQLRNGLIPPLAVKRVTAGRRDKDWHEV